MNFVKQIGAELKNMLRSKFILISAIVIFSLLTFVPPLIELVVDAIFNDDNNGYNVYYSTDEFGYTTQMEFDNELEWEVQHIEEMMMYAEDNLSNAQELQYAQELSDELIGFYSTYIDLITEYDYKIRVAYDMADYIGQNYILSLEEPIDIDELKAGTSYVRYYEGFIDSLEDKTDTEKQEIYDTNQTLLDTYYELVTNDDFNKYVDIQKILLQQRVEDYEGQIEALEESIVDNPENEEAFSQQIDQLNVEITNILEVEIPMLDYRAENNIVIDDGSWQDNALNRILYLTMDINSQSNVMTEEEFLQDQWLVDEHETYEKYVAYQEKRVQEMQFDLMVAQSSIDSGKPDMEYVSQGARASTHRTLGATMFIAIFAILVGGWAISSEFQSGTVRLLMIRPRTREKVYASRFIAGLILSYALFLAVFLFATIFNGFFYGFADYAYPNYTASGEINYFVMLIGDMLGTSVTVVFFFAFSYFASVLFKNMAVAIIVPTLLLVGTSIFMSLLTQLPIMQFLAFTPIPYISMQGFFLDDYVIQYLTEKGMMLSVGLGIATMLVYSAILVVTSLLAFKKQDITN